MTRRKRAPDSPWWETSHGPPPTPEELERRRANDAAHTLFSQRMRFQFWTALSEFFGDGAPANWKYSLVLVHFQSEGRGDPRIEIVGPRAGPAYTGMSNRFLEALSDLDQFRQEHGQEYQLGLTVRFALNRVDRCWSVALDPVESQLREWMRLLGYGDTDSEFRRVLRDHSGRDTASEE